MVLFEFNLAPNLTRREYVCLYVLCVSLFFGLPEIARRMLSHLIKLQIPTTVMLFIL